MFCVFFVWLCFFEISAAAGCVHAYVTILIFTEQQCRKRRAHWAFAVFKLLESSRPSLLLRHTGRGGDQDACVSRCQTVQQHNDDPSTIAKGGLCKLTVYVILTSVAAHALPL